MSAPQQLHIARAAEPDMPSGALVSALTTEHYTLQSARSSTVLEANGRSALFLSAVTGATVALALVAEVDGLGDTFVAFSLAVLPALLALGLMTYSRLADLAVQDAFYARAVGRIRSFYVDIDPGARAYWLLPAGDDSHAVMRQAGLRHSRWHHLTHAATAVAAVTAVVAGSTVGTIASALGALSLPWAVSASVATSAAVMSGLFCDQQRRWRQSADNVPSLFPQDPAPVAVVAAPG